MARIESVTAELLHDRSLFNVIARVRDSDGVEGVGEAWWGIADQEQPRRTASPIIAVINDMLAPGSRAAMPMPLSVCGSICGIGAIDTRTRAFSSWACRASTSRYGI